MSKKYENIDEILTRTMLKEDIPKSTTTTPFKKTIIEVRKKKKSGTQILCELARLKSQQKYLTCSQVKLKAENFMDLTKNDGTLISTANNEVVNIINEIECLKLQLNEQLQEYELKARHELQDFCQTVKSIKDDVYQPERLRNFTIQAIRKRIIAANRQLERLNKKNVHAIECLQSEGDIIESEVKQLTKMHIIFGG